MPPFRHSCIFSALNFELCTLLIFIKKENVFFIYSFDPSLSLLLTLARLDASRKILPRARSLRRLFKPTPEAVNSPPGLPLRCCNSNFSFETDRRRETAADCAGTSAWLPAVLFGVATPELSRRIICSPFSELSLLLFADAMAAFWIDKRFSWLLETELTEPVLRRLAPPLAVGDPGGGGGRTSCICSMLCSFRSATPPVSIVKSPDPPSGSGKTAFSAQGSGGGGG